jgi:hypothetical protein
MPVGIIEVDQINRWNATNSERDVVIDHRVFRYSDEVIPISQVGCYLKQMRGEFDIGVPIDVDLLVSVTDHVN